MEKRNRGRFMCTFNQMNDDPFLSSLFILSVVTEKEHNNEETRKLRKKSCKRENPAWDPLTQHMNSGRFMYFFFISLIFVSASTAMKEWVRRRQRNCNEEERREDDTWINFGGCLSLCFIMVARQDFSCETSEKRGTTLFHRGMKTMSVVASFFPMQSFFSYTSSLVLKLFHFLFLFFPFYPLSYLPVEEHLPSLFSLYFVKYPSLLRHLFLILSHSVSGVCLSICCVTLTGSICLTRERQEVKPDDSRWSCLMRG